MFRQTKRKKLLTFVMSSLSVEHKNYAKFWNLPFDYGPLIRNQFSSGIYIFLISRQSGNPWDDSSSTIIPNMAIMQFSTDPEHLSHFNGQLPVAIRPYPMIHTPPSHLDM